MIVSRNYVNEDCVYSVIFIDVFILDFSESYIHFSESHEFAGEQNRLKAMFLLLKTNSYVKTQKKTYSPAWELRTPGKQRLDIS